MNIVELYPIHTTEHSERFSPNIVQIGAHHKWRKGVTGKNIVVAIIDTGVDESHPYLSGRVIGGYNFTEDYNGNIGHFQDNNGHGTHVAGIIAGRFHTEHAVSGVAPDARLLALKVLDSSGAGSVDFLIEAIYYALDWRGPGGERVNVINLSLGVKNDDPLLHEAVKEAFHANIPIVTAAGNYGDGNHHSHEFLYPGAYKEVIQVGAMTAIGEVARFSNTNEEIDIYAPGVAIQSTHLKGKYITLSGTSMATPHVSGALALLIEEQMQMKAKPSPIFKSLCRHTKPMVIENENISGCGALYLGPQEF
ncbi:S8 family peptidase [Mesobacillus zeae]|uniref:Peptidase S8/S53 domain-containing protein n=1 Tax=Mesobacillus zeae TaxID=1917180 RepID=A0A398B4N3_9BACI|nr:S8 family peptidase [Mesobacillus zeae]RID82920.1 hypothetical protein D1970_17670 [Mesobacillus zeae]